MNTVDQNASEFLGRIQALERKLQAVADVQGEQADVLQTVVETQTTTVEYGHQNHIRNGDLNFTRNNYLYDTDFAGGTGEDGNVSLEAAHIYAHPKDTAIDTTGSVTLGLPQNLTLGTADATVGDVGVEIVVYGAGAAGADLTTTVDLYVSPTEFKLIDPVLTEVTNTRVRFRLLELKEDSTDVNADADLATNTTLKTPTHTRYATTVSDPDFDKENGWVRWSDAANTLTFPLAFNTLVPSKQYILTFIYKLSGQVDSEDEVFVDFYGGLWDNSPGRRQFLEGSSQPSLTGSAQGTTGATSRDYLVLMYMSDGSTVVTETLTVANTNATIDNDNYVELAWDQEPGVVRSEIYRNTAGTYVRLRPPYPAHTYYDKGLTSNTETGFPTATRERFIARTQVTTGNFSPAKQSWQLGQMNIVVPSDYDASATTDKQWLVIGMNTGFSGTGSDHALLVDLISLDDKFGLFSRCPLDFFAHRGVTSGPTSGDQGTTGGGPGPVEPGEGGGCPVFTDLIETDQGQVPAIDLVDNEHLYQIVDRNGNLVDYEACILPPQTVYTLIAKDYKLTASATHPVFAGEKDILGKPLSRFTENDIIETKQGNLSVDCLVKHFKKRHTVKFSLKGPERGFWQNGIAVHNEKPEF